MDRNEHNLKMEELKTAMHNRDYEKAVELADMLDLKKIKDNNFLSLVADAYEVTHKYQEAKKVLLLAYENTNAGRQLAYRLCLIAIKTKEYDEAEEFYGDFIEMAPRDTGRYILRYKMAKAKGEPIEKLIEILEEYVNIDMEEKWAYELAKLYHIAGDEEKCVDMCDEISLWFAEGKYVIKAMDLKKMHQSLTTSQQEKYEEGKKKNIEEAARLEAEKIEKKLKPFASEKDEIEDFQEIEIQPIEDEKFNTMEIQAVIADGMKEVAGEDNVNIHEDATATKIVPDVKRKETSDRQQPEQRADEISEVAEDGELEERNEEISGENKEPKEKKDAVEATVPKDDRIEEKPVLIEHEPIRDIQGVEDILRQLQERGILKAETVNQAVNIIDDVGLEKEGKEKKDDKEDNKKKENTVKKKKNYSGVQVTTVNPPKEKTEIPVFDLSYKSPERDTSNDIGQESMYENIMANSDLGNSTDRLPKKEEIDRAIEGAKQAEKEKSGEKGLHTQESTSVKVEILSGAEMEHEKEENKDKTEKEVTADQSNKTEEAKPEEAKTEQPEETEGEVKAEQQVEAAKAVKTENLTEEVKKEELENKTEKTEKELEEPDKSKENSVETEEKVKTFLTEEELSIFKNYLNVEGFELNIKEVLTDLITNFTPDGKSMDGNIIIMGDKKTGKTTLAIEMIKLVNKKRGRRDRRLAKVDAIVLNRRGFRNSMSKLLGSDLIVEKADQLGTVTLREMTDATDLYTDDMLIVFEGESEKMEQMLNAHPELCTVFNHVIRIKEYDIKEWAEYGKTYALSQGYSIDELADLAFHKAIDDFFGENNRMSKSDVELIVDKAISKSKRFGRKISGVFSSKKDEKGLNTLVESDFNF